MTDVYDSEMNLLEAKAWRGALECPECLADKFDSFLPLSSCIGAFESDKSYEFIDFFRTPQKNCRRPTPIWLAASGFGPVETLRALIDRYPTDLDVACFSVSGREMYVCVVRTPLMEAVKNGATERVRILLDAGCRVDLVLRDRFRCCKYRHLFLKPAKELFWKKRFDTNY